MSAWQGKRVLVTGAGGFIGSHLVELLASLGSKVRAMVHYNSRNDIGALAHIDADCLADIEIVQGEITDSGSVSQAVEGCDCVFHLAALIGIPYSYSAPRSYVATNIGGTLNVLDAVRRCETPRMVHTSTSETYGTALYEPIDEKHPLQCQSPYSASKAGADKLAESYYLSFDVPVATIRPFNTFGPRQSARAVIPVIIAQLLAGKNTVELGSLTPRRDFTFVKDTARGFVAIAEAEKCLGQVTNIGAGKAITIGQLADTLVSMINPSARVVSTESRVRPASSEVMALICDNAKARDLAGWSPEVSLEKGLQETVGFIRDHLTQFNADQYVV